MHSNQKLTKIIAGRTIAGTSQGKNGKGEDVWLLTFGDGSIMTIKAAQSITVQAGDKVLKVRQGGTELDLDLEDKTTIKITTAEETSCVMLRDKAGKLEYAD